MSTHLRTSAHYAFFAGASSDTQTKIVELQTTLEVLNSNALIAALFLSFELPMLQAALDDLPDWMRRAVLWSTVTAILMHVTCIFTAAEVTFVFGRIKLFDEAKQVQEIARFQHHALGKNVLMISGYTFLLGISLGIVAYGIPLGRTFHLETDGTIALIIIICFLAALRTVFHAFGSYVASMGDLRCIPIAVH